MSIVQFWHSSDIPEEIQALIDTWTTLNPEREHRLFNNSTAVEFMHANFSEDVAAAFDLITIPAMRCDVFRVAYLLLNGGLYADCGSKCFMPISEWGIDENRMTLMRKWHGGVWNGLICAPAGHPWLQELWQQIEAVLLKHQDGDIWSLTGPLLFTRIAEKEAALADTDKRYHLPGYVTQGRSLEVIDQADCNNRFTPVNDLKHKSRAHWSRLQNIVPLFATREFIENKRQNANPKFAGHLTICLAHSKSSQSELAHYHRTLLANKDWTNIDIQLSNHTETISVLQNELVAEFATKLGSSPTDSICTFIDLTACMSEPEYSKKTATQLLNTVSKLCDLFASSEIRFAVSDQTSLIANYLQLSGTPWDKENMTPEEQSKAIQPLFSSLALDFNLLDEGLKFFFPHSHLKPLPIICDHKQLTPAQDKFHETVLEEIQQHFAESNQNLFDKYPALHKDNTSVAAAHAAA